jgi:hypothetical protein
MPVPYSNIYDMFLSDIKDCTLLDFDAEDREKILDDLRIKAETQFKQCKNDLSDKDDIEKQYNSDLTIEEQLIIATIMRKFWMNDKIYNLSLLKQAMSTKDWKQTSQAEHLLRLTVLMSELNKEISKMIVDYCTYNYKVE